MSLSRRIAFAAFSGWISRVVSIGLSLLLFRALFARLGAEERGVWLLLGNSAAFLSLMDLGMTATLTRHMALARGKSGADPSAVIHGESRQELADLVATGRHAYRYVALLVFLGSMAIGFFFLSQLTFHSVTSQLVWMSWTILCVGYAINVWGQVWICLLNGVGLVGWSAMVDTIVGGLSVTAQIILVLCGGGILQLAIVAALSGLFSRQISLWMARKAYPDLFKVHGNWSGPLFRAMVAPSTRAWLTTLGAFLILKTDQYFITLFRGAAELSDYTAAYQVVSNLNVFATSLAAGSAVYVSHLWQAGDMARVHGVVRRILRIGMFIMVCGVACLIFAGQPLIDVWLGAGHFIGYPILMIFCVMLTLETHHVIVATFSRATEDEAFAFPAMLSGVINLILTYILMRAIGLIGVALGTLLAQMATNNWYAVYRGLHRLRISWREHFIGVVLPVLSVFAAAIALSLVATLCTQSFSSRLPTLLSVLFATGTVLAISLWTLALAPEDRQRIKGIVQRKLLRRPSPLSVDTVPPPPEAPANVQDPGAAV